MSFCIVAYTFLYLDSRAKDVEVELQDVRDAMRRLEGDYQVIFTFPLFNPLCGKFVRGNKVWIFKSPRYTGGDFMFCTGSAAAGHRFLFTR